MTSNTYEILSSSFDPQLGTLNTTPDNTYEVLNTVYDAEKEALRIKIDGVRANIEDLHDSGSVTLLSANAGTWVEYTNNANEYHYVNNGIYWDNTNNILEFEERVLDSTIDIVLKTTVSPAAANTMLHVELYIPHPSGDIHVAGQTVYMFRNVAHEEMIAYHVYCGQYVIDYGLKIRTKIDSSLKSDTVLSDRRMLIRN